jgi:hypothetical protein
MIMIHICFILIKQILQFSDEFHAILCSDGSRGGKGRGGIVKFVIVQQARGMALPWLLLELERRHKRKRHRGHCQEKQKKTKRLHHDNKSSSGSRSSCRSCCCSSRSSLVFWFVMLLLMLCSFSVGSISKAMLVGTHHQSLPEKWLDDASFSLRFSASFPDQRPIVSRQIRRPAAVAETFVGKRLLIYVS